jgi:hypothetical protein
MGGINASVGKFGGGKQCYNFARDQQIVQNLLNQIPQPQGGAGGTLTDRIVDRVVSASLHQAILNFQRANHCSVDGHVDPHQRTIQLMNELAGGSPTPPSPGSSSLSFIDFWLNAFIPNSVCTKKGDVFVVELPDNRTPLPLPTRRFFTGDQREFSSNRDASARMHSEVRIVGLSSDNPRIAVEKQIIGESQEVDDNGHVIGTATASNSRMKFSNLRGSQTVDPNGGVIDGIPGSVQIDLDGAASLPLHAKAADIDYTGTLIIDRLEGNVLFKGAVDEFPAFELYFRANDRSTVTLARIDPAIPIGLVGEPNRPVDAAARIVL